MNDDRRREIDEVFAQYGPITNIPARVLEEKRLRVIHDPRGTTYQLVTEEDHRELVQQAHLVMAKYEGYIFADNLTRFFRLFNCYEMLGREAIAQVARYAQGFVNAGIPPIFQQRWYTPTFFEWTLTTHTDPARVLFPTVDFVIQFATGAYDRRRAAIGQRLQQSGLQKRGDRRIPIQPTSPKDVREFRQIAFTAGGKVNPLLIRETITYAEKHFNFSSPKSQSEHIDQDYSLFLFLEEQLHSLPCEPLPSQIWDQNPSTASQPRWYLGFQTTEHTRIVRAFLDSLPLTLNETDRRRLTCLELLYPDVVDQWRRSREQQQVAIEEERLRRLVTQARQTGAFSIVPMNTFTDLPWSEWSIPVAQAYLRDVCQALKEKGPAALLKPIGWLRFTLAKPLFQIAVLGDIVSTAQMNILQNMSDGEFLQVFSGGEGFERFKALQRSVVTRKKTAISQELQRVLRARYQQLCRS